MTSVCKALDSNEQIDEYIIRAKRQPYMERWKGLPHDLEMSLTLGWDCTLPGIGRDERQCVLTRKRTGNVQKSTSHRSGWKSTGCLNLLCLALPHGANDQVSLLLANYARTARTFSDFKNQPGSEACPNHHHRYPQAWILLRD